MTEPRRCCKDCENRTVNCHCTCEDYAEYKRELAEFNEAVQKAKDRERVMDRYCHDNYRKRRWMK